MASSTVTVELPSQLYADMQALAQQDAPLAIRLQVFGGAEKGTSKSGGAWVGQWQRTHFICQPLPLPLRKEQQTLIRRVASHHETYCQLVPKFCRNREPAFYVQRVGVLAKKHVDCAVMPLY